MVEKCECLECIKAESFKRFLNRPGMVGDSLEDNANSIFDGKILYANSVITSHSKNPDMYFPLTDNIRTWKAGSFLGSVTDVENVDGNVWVNTQLAGWFHYTPDKVTLKNVSGEPLDNDAKLHMVKAVLNTTPTGAGAAIETVETISELSFDAIKYVLIGVGILIAAVLVIKFAK